MPTADSRPSESILVCLNYGTHGMALVERAHQLAQAHSGSLTIMVFDSLDDDSSVDRAVELPMFEDHADSIGAGLVHLRGPAADMALQIIRVAGKVGATQVVIGQPTESRWATLLGYSVVQTLLDRVPTADLHIVPDDRSRAPDEGEYEPAIAVWLKPEGEGLRVVHGEEVDGGRLAIFYRERNTDFDHGLALLDHDNEMLLLPVHAGLITRSGIADASPVD